MIYSTTAIKRSCCFLIAVFLCLPRVWADDTIRLLRGASYDMSVSQHGAILNIPVTLPPGQQRGKPRVTVVSARLENYPDNAHIPEFKTSMGNSGTNQPVIRIQLEDDALLRAGAYSLILEISNGKDANGQEKTQQIPLTINVKPAVIRVMPALVVANIQPFWGKGKLNLSSLNMAETSGLSYIKTFTVRPVDNLVDAKAAMVPARIEFKKGVPIPPDQQANIGYSLNGDLPLGKVTGNFEIVSPQLAAPVPFRMEITSKRGTWLLIAIIILGLLTGYLNRTYFELRIQKNTARLKAIKLLEQVVSKRAAYPDKLFQDEITAIAARLTSAINTGNTEEITQAATDAETTLKTATDNLNALRETVQKELDTAFNTFNTGWLVPETVAPLIQTAKEGVNAAMEENAQFNATAALQRLKQVNRDFLDKFREMALAYKGQLTADLASLAGVRLPFSGTEEPLKSVTDTVNTLTIDPQDADISKHLSTLHSIQLKMQELLNALQIQCTNIYRDTSGVLNSQELTLPDAPAMNAFAGAIQQVLDILTAKKPRENRIQELVTPAAKLEALLKTAILSQLEITNTDAAIEEKNTAERQLIETQVKNAQYTEAAKATLAFLLRNKEGQTARGMTMPMQRINNQLVNFAPEARFQVNSQAIPEKVTTIAPVPDAPQVAQLHTATYRSLLAAKAWQTVAAGVGIIFVGYLIYHENFIGTAADLGMAFFWALSLDISIATLMTIGGNATKRP